MCCCCCWCCCCHCHCWCCCRCYYSDADYCADSMALCLFLNSYLGRFLFCTDFFRFLSFQALSFCSLPRSRSQISFSFFFFFFLLYVLSLVAFLASPIHTIIFRHFFVSLLVIFLCVFFRFIIILVFWCSGEHIVPSFRANFFSSYTIFQLRFL